MLDDVCYEWESRCNMVLGFDYIEEIWQKDVNNYIFKQFDGKIERKGGYVKDLSELDNDLPIVNKALVDFMLTGVPVEKTISDCDDMVMFQRICKRGSSYQYVEWNNKRLDNKCFRIFASVDPNDGAVYKVKSVGGKKQKDKFANTSKNSFIENGDVNGVTVTPRLDKQWYIDLALTRLEQYGVGGQDDIFSWIRKD
jgi:DNA polymerase